MVFSNTEVDVEKSAPTYHEHEFHESSRFTWNKVHKKSRNRSISLKTKAERIQVAIKIVIVIVICFVPTIIFRISYSKTPLFPVVSPGIPSYKAKSFFQSMSHLGLLFLILTPSYFGLLILFNIVISFVIRKIKNSESENVLKKLEAVEFFRSLKNNIISVILIAIANLVWIILFFESSLDAFDDEASSSQSFNQLTFKFLVLLLVSSLLFLAQSIIMQRLVGTFHRNIYKGRIQRQKKICEAIEYFDSPKKIINNNYILSRESRIDSKVANTIGFIYNTKENETELTVKAIHHANYIFYRVILDKTKKVLTPEDFIEFYDDKEEAIESFKLFDTDKKKSISLIEFQQTFIEYYNEKGAIKGIFGDMSDVLGKVNRFLLCIVLLIIFVFLLVILTYNPLKNILSFGSLAIAWSFIFGNSLKTSFDCFIFLFMVNPYDIGDHVYIDLQNMIVKKVRLLSTIFEKLDGQYITIPNIVLSQKSIINFRRSENQSEKFGKFLPFYLFPPK
ncbi:Mechanosensitive ion channel protein 10 [Smittium culicis]|uniref:Mechanosensitive ion channel protein 10 n=1 Tax=Smittium culicis TaxID=133412 RepID=A0A1R1YQ66_9FUNG|nr:Mechanosensitive ion channel protein 10 [Smittium culicis]